jgi:hypothetical protein
MITVKDLKAYQSKLEEQKLEIKAKYDQEIGIVDAKISVTNDLIAEYGDPEPNVEEETLP